MSSNTRMHTSKPIFEDDDGLVQNGSISSTNTASSTTCSEDDDYEETVVSAFTSRRRLARFSRVVQVYLIESHDYYTDEEHLNCWYTPGEQCIMEYNRGQYVSRMNAGKAQEKHNRTYRGLETCSEEGYVDFQEQKIKTVDAVMDEQERQWAENVTDEIRIEAASRQVTATSAEKARHMARLDELEAMTIHNADCKVLRHIPTDTKPRFVPKLLMKASNSARRDRSPRCFIATVA